VNHSGGKRADKAHGIADGNREFAGPQLRRIGRSSGWEVRGVNAKPREIAQWITRLDGGFEFAPIPKLNRGPCASHDVGVGNQSAVV
jgi:hypothetical protein